MMRLMMMVIDDTDDTDDDLYIYNMIFVEHRPEPRKEPRPETRPCLSMDEHPIDAMKLSLILVFFVCCSIDLEGSQGRLIGLKQKMQKIKMFMFFYFLPGVEHGPSRAA